MNPPRSTVAVVRSNNRRGAVAEALALIAAEIANPLAPEVMVLPDFTSPRQPWAWTQPDALSATLDGLFSWGTDQVAVQSPDDWTLDRSRFRPETFGRAVRHQFASDRNETNAWTGVELDPGDGRPVSVRVIRPGAFVSIATMKTAATSSVALGLVNLLSLVHPEDRAAIEPTHRKPRGGRSVADLLGGGFARIRGRALRFAESFSNRNDPDVWRKFGPNEIALLEQAERSSRLIAGLAAFARPVLSVVDGFHAMHREGPRHGESIRLGVVVAGSDPVAVDAVAAMVMGFHPTEIAHLERVKAEGLGEIDLDSIAIVGDSLASVRRCSVPHSNQKILRHASRLSNLVPPTKRDSIIPAPHSRPARSSNPVRG